MRRLVLLPLLGLLLAAPAAAPAAKKPDRHWAQAEIQAVAERGLLGGDAQAFRPDEPLTRGTLARALGTLFETEAETVTEPGAPVTIAQLDTALVRALGLGDAAYRFYRTARAAGLRLPARFGTEVVARALGLRVNHPAPLDALELGPDDPATRAEAAYSLAAIMELDEWALEGVGEAAKAFALPSYTPRQREILGNALSLVGHPYVWGGTGEGFDCSGFVWRVYKLQRYAGAEALSATLRGRTSYAMSAEVDPAKRIAAADLAPADVLFFGARGPKSKPAEVDHMGIYVGNGWMVHSSRFGVTMLPVAGWYSERFAWGRRPLAEAGLTV